MKAKHFVIALVVGVILMGLQKDGLVNNIGAILFLASIGGLSWKATIFIGGRHRGGTEKDTSAFPYNTAPPSITRIPAPRTRPSHDEYKLDTKDERESLHEFVAVDVETTGLYPSEHEIIEIAAVLFCDGKEADRFEHLINPGRSIPRSATQINGISNAMVRDQPFIADVFPLFMEFVGDRVLTAHNAPFDLRFLDSAAARLGLDFDNKVIDTLPHARQLFADLSNHKLGTLVNALGLANNETLHRGGIDALCTGRLLVRCIAEYDIYDDYSTGRQDTFLSGKPRLVWPDVEYDTEAPIEIQGKYFCFSGHFGKLDWDGVEAYIIKNGGKMRKTACMSLDYLLVGQQDANRVQAEYGYRSGIIHKAINMRKAGHKVRIIPIGYFATAFGIATTAIEEGA